MDSDMDIFEIPMGFGMALAQNMDALNYFSSLPKYKQREIIDGTHKINSKSEMRSYVDNIYKN